MMNRRGFLPLIIAIPLFIIGGIILFFIFKAVMQLLIQAVLWAVGITLFFLVIYLIYKIVRWSTKK